MQEKGCVFEQRVYYSKTILENFRRCPPFFSNFIRKRVHFGKISEGNSMFFTEKLQEKGFLFQKNCMRKGMDSETALAHQLASTPPPQGFWPNCLTPHLFSVKVSACSVLSNKNVLQFLLISAHGRTPFNLVSKYRVHLAVHQCAGGMLVMCSRAEQLGHSLPYILYGNV